MRELLLYNYVALCNQNYSVATPLTDLLKIRSTGTAVSSSNSSPFGANTSLPETSNSLAKEAGSHNNSLAPAPRREFSIGTKRPADRDSDSGDAFNDEPNGAPPSPPRSSASPAPPVPRFSVSTHSPYKCACLDCNLNP